MLNRDPKVHDLYYVEHALAVTPCTTIHQSHIYVTEVAANGEVQFICARSKYRMTGKDFAEIDGKLLASDDRRFVTLEWLRSVPACEIGLIWFRNTFKAGHATVNEVFRALVEETPWPRNIPGTWIQWLLDKLSIEQYSAYLSDTLKGDSPRIRELVTEVMSVHGYVPERGVVVRYKLPNQWPRIIHNVILTEAGALRLVLTSSPYELGEKCMVDYAHPGDVEAVAHDDPSWNTEMFKAASNPNMIAFGGLHFMVRRAMRIEHDKDNGRLQGLCRQFEDVEIDYGMPDDEEFLKPVWLTCKSNRLRVGTCYRLNPSVKLTRKAMTTLRVFNDGTGQLCVALNGVVRHLMPLIKSGEAKVVESMPADDVNGPDRLITKVSVMAEVPLDAVQE